MAPRVPELRKAVAEDHWKALTRLDDMHPDAVGVDEFVGQFVHRI
jgi:hypothetical protein